MSYVVNNHLNNLYVLSSKAVGPGKNNTKLINVGPTSIPEAGVGASFLRLKGCQINLIDVKGLQIFDTNSADKIPNLQSE